MKRVLVTLILLGGGCYYDHSRDCRYGVYGPTCGNGGAGGGGNGGASGPGHCSSDTQCGGGLVCDKASGACASSTPGCGQNSFMPRRASGDILLVLDHSNSMQNPTTSGTKWTDLLGALDQVVTDTGTQVKWGLEIFPASTSQACTVGGVDVPPAANNAQNVLSRIHATQPDGAGTPTREAVRAAGSYLAGLGDGSQKYILLATDGEPNCAVGNPDENASDRDAAVAAVRAVATAGASTFVIGVAISPDADTTLSQMAVAGGEARSGMTAYFPAANAHDLEAALAVVARQVALCTFDLMPPPPIGDTIELTIGGRPFPRNQMHMGDGWDFTNGGKSIALYGAACDAVQAGGAIVATYVCGAGTMCNTANNQCVPIPGGTGGTGGGGTGGGGGGGAGGGGGSGGTGGGGGTGGSGGGPGSMCRYNAQCGPGGICTDGMCSPACTQSSQCGTGDVCLSGNCVPSPSSGGQCTFNTDCAGSATCINGFCHPNCTADSQCPPNDICDHGVCQPNWHRIPSCTSNAQCGGGMACVDGICRTPCWQATDCAASPSGSVCWTGYCF